MELEYYLYLPILIVVVLQARQMEQVIVMSHLAGFAFSCSNRTAVLLPVCIEFTGARYCTYIVVEEES